MSSGGTFEQIGQQASRALLRLGEWLAGDGIFTLLGDLGLDLPDTPAAAAVRTAAGDLAAAAQDLQPAVDSLTAALQRDPPDEVEIVGATADLFLAIADVTAAVAPLRAAVENFNGIPAPALADFGRRLLKRLIDYVAVTHLEREQPLILRLLVALDLVRLERVAPDAAAARPSHVLRSLNLDGLKLLFDPSANLPEALYRWGHNDLRAEPLLEILSEIAVSAGIPAFYSKPQGEEARIDLGPLELVHRPDLDPSGFAVQIDRDGFGLSSFEIPLTPGLTAQLQLEAVLTQSPAILIQPGGPPRLQTPGALQEGRAALAFTWASDSPAGKLTLLGIPGGTRFEADAIRASGAVRVEPSAAGTHLIPSLEASIRGGAVVVDLSGSDSFVAGLVSGGLRFDFDFGLGWDLEKGLYLTEGAGLEATFPIQKELGPILIETLNVGVGARDEGVRLEVSATLNGELGPISFSVDRIGIRVDFKTTGGDGKPLRVEFGLKPPSGLGASVDAGGVGGGGYLYFDPDKGEYAGALELAFGSIALTAVGLLATKLPDGRRGFSLLVIIAVEFSPGIQLGYGFSLTGVGGLLGIHRTVAVEAMQDGVRSGAARSILFPEDPVRNAPQVIRDLESIFPSAVGRHVFGPMLGIGWGLPRPLIKMEVGVLLELPAPIRLILLGRVQMLLPDEETPLARINMDSLGIWDSGQGMISLDATLYDSVITIYSLSGDMAMRIRYLSNPQFALSIGGLHPAFQPPAGFPDLERIAVSMSSGNNPRLRLEAYFALTSNTLQVGARLDLYASAAGFSISGSLGFDALFQFSPFKFVVAVSGRVALKRGSSTLMSLSITLTLSGVSPWRATGRVTFKVLFFKGSIGFDKTFGGGAQPAVPTLQVWPLLKAALEDKGAWSAQLPAAASRMVSLASDAGAGEAVSAHPLGTLTVRQRVVPFGIELDHVGQAAPTDGNRFELTPLAGLGEGAERLDWGGEPVRDDFAAAQFQDLSDQEKLSRPSFEKMQAGLALAESALAMGSPKARSLDYEEILIDKRRERAFPLHRLGVKVGLSDAEFKLGASLGVVRADLRLGRAPRFAAKSLQVSLADPVFALVDEETLEVGSTAPAGSHSELHGALREARERGRGARQPVAESSEWRRAE